MSKVIGVFNSTINMCPICGFKFNFKDKNNFRDWSSGCSQSCPKCNFQFQLSTTKNILSIAEDLDYYIKQEVE